MIRLRSFTLLARSVRTQRGSSLLASIGTRAKAGDDNTNTGSSSSSSSRSNERFAAFGLVAAVGVAGAVMIDNEQKKCARRVAFAADEVNSVDWEALRKDIASILAKDGYDDGHYGPVLVRLAWHGCGTYCKDTQTGGSDGATMRFDPEAKHGANAGLHVARGLLEPLHKKYPSLSISDLWQFAAVVAIEEMGGPKIPFRPGRVDKPDESHCTPDGRLPDAAQGPQHLRDIFYRMGFNDQEIVALSGAHCIGRCHTDRSGFHGPWTKAPTMFTNLYFDELLSKKWTVRDWKGPKQYEDPAKELMMLPSDLALIEDEKFLVWVKKYREDEQLFFKDFAKAFQKLQELGVKKFVQDHTNVNVGAPGSIAGPAHKPVAYSVLNV